MKVNPFERHKISDIEMITESAFKCATMTDISKKRT